MTPAALRAICDSLNDERGMGGQTKLARLLGWHHSTVWRKLNGKSRHNEYWQCKKNGDIQEKRGHTRKTGQEERGHNEARKTGT
jgi:hypothetical protein